MMQPALNQRDNSFARKYGFTKPLFLLAFAMLGFISPTSVHASTTSGTIDTVHKYAFSNVGGYVNFAPDKGGLTITDSAITGYAWSANTGWINFDTIQSGVTNNGEGTLGGFAWDSSAGWISFSGVTIDSLGQFHGQATGGTVNGASYVINFECTSCVVSTDWRPISSRPVATGGGGSSSSLPRTTPNQTVTTVTTVSTAPAFPQEKGTVKKGSPQPTAPGISNGNIGAISSSVGNYVENAVSSVATQSKNIFLNLIHSIWLFILSLWQFLLTAWHSVVAAVKAIWHFFVKF